MKKYIFTKAKSEYYIKNADEKLIFLKSILKTLNKHKDIFSEKERLYLQEIIQININFFKDVKCCNKRNIRLKKYNT